MTPTAFLVVQIVRGAVMLVLVFVILEVVQLATASQMVLACLAVARIVCLAMLCPQDLHR